MLQTPDPSGALLRRFRQQSKLTLIEASRKFGYSTAVLSRLERGLRISSRSELLLMVRGYNLSHWEAHALLTSAGYLPELPVQSVVETERALLMLVLEQMTQPAFIMEASGYLIAWNSILQSLWGLRDDNPVHILDHVFSPSVQKLFGDTWRSRAVNAVWLFYVRTLHSPNQKAFVRVIDHLAAKYGPQFQSIWNEALARGHNSGNHKTPEEAGLVTAEYETSAGRIAYTVTRAGLQAASYLALFMLVPLGRENSLRQIQLQSVQERVHMITPHNPGLPFSIL